VQLLVSTNDVENYRQIKQDLDELRLLVEKSELWVYKSKYTEGKKKKKAAAAEGEDGDERVKAVILLVISTYYHYRG
jgi:inositol 1,4,5-triphosphate receptor type 1